MLKAMLETMHARAMLETMQVEPQMGQKGVRDDTRSQAASSFQPPLLMQKSLSADMMGKQPGMGKLGLRGIALPVLLPIKHLNGSLHILEDFGLCVWTCTSVSM